MKTTHLKWLIDKMTISLRKIGSYIDIDAGTLSKLSQGERKISTKYVERMADFFQVTINFLLDREEKGVKCIYMDEEVYLTPEQFDLINDKIPISTTIVDKKVYRLIVRSETAESIIKLKPAVPKVAYIIDNYFDNDYQRRLMAILKEINLSIMFAGGDFHEHKTLLKFAEFLYYERFKREFDADNNDYYMNLAKGKMPKEFDVKMQDNFINLMSKLSALTDNEKETINTVITAITKKGD